jgi:polyisoprenoid-binding protein YceI
LWSSTPGVGYQPQYKTDLTGATWFNLGALQTATSTYTSVTDNDNSGAERYYRVVIGVP